MKAQEGQSVERNFGDVISCLLY